MSRRILVVEDDDDTQDYLAKALRETGYTVEATASGREGLMHALGGGFDALVLDRMLPDLDGLSLLKSVRAAGVQTPAIILTAMSAIDERVRGLRAGADDYVVKPFSYAELSARLEAVLRRPAETRPEETRLACGDLELDLIARTARRGDRADRAPAARVPDARVPDAPPGPRRHPHHAARRGLGLPLRPAHQRHRRAHQPPPPQDRRRGRAAADPHRARLGLQARRRRLTRMFRNATMRLIAAHLVLVAVSTALVLGSLYWRIGGVIDTEQRAVVEAELRGLADDYARGGTPALAAAIGQRHGQPARPRRHLPARRRRRPPHHRQPRRLAADGRARRRLDHARPLPHRPLAPDRDLRARRRAPQRRAPPRRPRRRRPRRLRPHASGARSSGRSPPSSPSPLATGWLLSRLVSGRIAEIDGAARAIMAGALDRRVALRGTGDEFDRLAGTLNAMLDRIETLVRDLRTVTDSLAHDLRSPLGRLVRHLEAAADEEAPAETRRARIEQALREAEGVLSTATALLDISRIDAGIGAEQFTAVDLGRLAADVAELYEAAAEERGLTLACDTAPGLVVRGHDQLLALALSNLVDNALKHAPAGSAITVTAALDGGRPALVVGDRGPGIPEADRARALGRFVRLDPSRGSPGAGLGLALVAAVARMHGAEIILGDNAPGLRATLRFARPPKPGNARSAVTVLHPLTFAIQSGSETSPFDPSPRRILSTTSMPEITSPTTVYWPFRKSPSANMMKNWLLAEFGSCARAMPTVPARRACRRTPPADPAGPTRRCPPGPRRRPPWCRTPRRRSAP